MKIAQITKEQLRKVIIAGCHLHQWQGKDKEELQQVFRDQGMVQLDPLNPAGRNHDIFFSSRILNYRIGDFEKTVYPAKLVFETYFPNLFAISAEYFPLFYSRMGKEHFLGRYYKSRYQKIKEINADLLDKVLDHIKTKGPARSTDKELAELGKAFPEYAMWKTSKNSGVAMELLWAMGKLAVTRDVPNMRKKYDILENQIDEQYRIKKEYEDDELEYLRLQLRLRSYPVLSTGKISLTKQGRLKSSKKNSYPLNLILTRANESDRNVPILVELDEDKTGLLVPSNWEKLVEEKNDDVMRAIAPLDPSIWDRKILKTVFDYDYVWEVYKRAKDRVWGYYVYPLLYRGEFVGRMEVKYEKKTKMLRLFNISYEKGFELDQEAEEAFNRLIVRWKALVGAAGESDQEAEEADI